MHHPLMNQFNELQLLLTVVKQQCPALREIDVGGSGDLSQGGDGLGLK